MQSQSIYKMTQDKLTPKEKQFADNYIENGNARQAIKDTYNIGGKGGRTDPDGMDSTADQMAIQTLRKVRVQQYLEDKAEVAASIIFELAQNSEMDNVRLGASKDIMDRAGYKPVEKSINLNVEAEITNPKARELAEKYEEELKKGL